MALNFPDSPTIGDEFTGGGFTWVWDGSNWSKISTAVSGANDFALLVGTSGDTTYVLDRTYTSGRYTIEFVNGDTTYDIYAITTDGTYAGYTNGTIIEITADFAEVVVLGAATSETILFSYQGTLTSPSSTGDVAVAGAFLSSTSETSLPDIDDFTVLSGGNFAADVAVAFIGQDAVVRAAKSVTRSSSTELLATRPDDFPVAQSPYSVRVLNPGIPAPAGTNAHILSNAINAGTTPVWQTTGDLAYNVGAATPDITLVATDTEGSAMTYSVVSGTIPAGLTLTEATGVINGTFSGTASDGDTNSVTFRATDAGGNFLDKAFNFVANGAPVWTTPAGAIDTAFPDSAYSYQLAASTGLAGGALSYSVVLGTLPTGLTLSTSGLISGTNTDPAGTIANFTVRVTDSLGLFADRAFSIEVVVAGASPYFIGAKSDDAEAKFYGKGIVVDSSTFNSMSTWTSRSITYNNYGMINEIRSDDGTTLSRHFHYRPGGPRYYPRAASTDNNGNFYAIGSTDIGSGSDDNLVFSSFSSAARTNYLEYAPLSGYSYDPRDIISATSGGALKHFITGDYTIGRRLAFIQIVNSAGNSILGDYAWLRATPNNNYTGWKGTDWNPSTERLCMLTDGWNGEREITIFDDGANIQSTWMVGPVSARMNKVAWDPSDNTLVMGTDGAELLRYTDSGTFLSANKYLFDGTSGNIVGLSVTNSQIFFITSSRYVVCLDRATMSVVWAKKFDQGGVYGPIRPQANGITVSLTVGNVKTFEFLIPASGDFAGTYTFDGSSVVVSDATVTATTPTYSHSSVSYGLTQSLTGPIGSITANQISYTPVPDLTTSYASI